MKTPTSLVLSAIFAVLASPTSQAQTLATYSEGNLVKANDYLAPSGVDTTTTIASNDTTGAGIVIDNNFGFGGYADIGDDGNASPFPTTLANAQKDGVYFQFNLAPVAGSVLDITAVDFSTANIFNYTGDTADYVYTLRSSADSYATNLGSFSLTGGSIAYGSKLTFTAPVIDATPAGVNFELLVTRPDSTQNYSYAYVPLSGSFSVDGTAISVPEPGAYALLAMGLAGLALKFRPRRIS